MKKALKLVSLVLVLLAFNGCSTVPTAQNAPTILQSNTVNDKIALGYQSVSTMINEASLFYQANKITKDQFSKIIDNAQNAKNALDFASGKSLVCPSNPCTIDDQLILATSLLLQIQQVLVQYEGTK